MHPPKSPTVAAGLCMMHHRPRHTLARSNQSEPGMCYVRLPSGEKEREGDREEGSPYTYLIFVKQPFVIRVPSRWLWGFLIYR
eukprot:181967-Amorphochlora_amoeboformis.AAC.1